MVTPRLRGLSISIDGFGAYDAWIVQDWEDCFALKFDMDDFLESALNKEFEIKLGGPQPYPGMQAEMMIVTGGQAALEYFLKPLTSSLNHAFREA
jgi:hypothetical protein